MISRIKLTNFKCFEQLDLSCKHLNLLCGLNGMGKSSIIQAMLVLRQSHESNDLLNGRLSLNGNLVDLGTVADVLFEDAERDVLGFSLEWDECEDQWGLDFDCGPTASQSTLQAINFSQNPYERSYRPAFFPPFVGRLVYVNAERVGPRKTYPTSDILARQGDFGSSSEYAWNYLSQHQDDLLPEGDLRCQAKGSRRLLDIVDRWLQDITPGAHLQLDRVVAADAVIAGFSFDRQGDVESRQHRATNVGFGLSYALPVILALLSQAETVDFEDMSISQTLCLVENPEAHLHPRGQTKLAELAVRAARMGVQVFVESHSDHFMDGVRIAVRDGLMGPEDIAFHYFEREGNKTTVASPQIDADGRLSTWPDGFFDQHDENLARLLAPRP